MQAKRVVNTLVGIVLIGSCGLVSSQSCDQPDGCINEGIASFIAPIDALLAKCSQRYPENAQTYQESAQRILGKVDQEVLEKLRVSAVYAKVGQQAEARINKLDRQKLRDACQGIFAAKP